MRHTKALEQVPAFLTGVQAQCPQSSLPTRGPGLSEGQAAPRQEGPEARLEPAHLPELRGGWGGSLSSVGGGVPPSSTSLAHSGLSVGDLPPKPLLIHQRMDPCLTVPRPASGVCLPGKGLFAGSKSGEGP